MTRAELRAAIDQAGYAFGVHLGDNLPSQEGWAINNDRGIRRLYYYYFERGARHTEHDFADESSACEWLWNRIQTEQASFARVARDPSIYPGYFGREDPDRSACRRRHNPGYGWEVYRHYIAVDGRPSQELLAVYRTEQEASDHQARILAAIAKQP